MKKDQINVDSSLRIGLFLNWTTMLKTGVLKDDFSGAPLTLSSSIWFMVYYVAPWSSRDSL